MRLMLAILLLCCLGSASQSFAQKKSFSNKIDAATCIQSSDLVKAEGMLHKHIASTYHYAKTDYCLGLYEKKYTAETITFLLSHTDDANQSKPGGDLSRLFEVDMRTMSIVRELIFQ